VKRRKRKIQKRKGNRSESGGKKKCEDSKRGRSKEARERKRYELCRSPPIYSNLSAKV
jgi:hypothetical protein